MSPVVLLIAIFVTVGVTALLIGVLSRINTPPKSVRRRGGSDAAVGSDGGGSGRGSRQDADQSDSDSSSDGGGDGGGGGD